MHQQCDGNRSGDEKVGEPEVEPGEGKQVRRSAGASRVGYRRGFRRVVRQVVWSLDAGQEQAGIVRVRHSLGARATVTGD